MLFFSLLRASLWVESKVPFDTIVEVLEAFLPVD
jgi:hypothetical protein